MAIPLPAWQTRQGTHMLLQKLREGPGHFTLAGHKGTVITPSSQVQFPPQEFVRTPPTQTSESDSPASTPLQGDFQERQLSPGLS